MKKSPIICVVFVTCLIACLTTSCSKKGSSNPAPTPEQDLTPDSLKPGLLAYYPFDNNGNDVSGHGNNGTVYNETPTSDRHGKANGAYAFDGYTTFITVPGTPALTLNNTDFTISVWVKLYSYGTTTYMNVITRRLKGINNRWGLGVTGVNSTTPGLTFFSISGTTSAYGNKVVDYYGWHMLTAVYNLSAQQMSIYVDGQLDNTITGIPSPDPPATSNLFIGGDREDDSGSPFVGSIEEIRIYNRMLSANAIKSLYSF